MIQNSQPTPEEPWNRRWAIMLKPSTPSHSTSQIPPSQTSRDKSSGEAGDSRGDWGGQVKAKLIGTIGTPRKAEVGYKLHPEYWGKGYMSEALEMFLRMWWGMEGKFISLFSLVLARFLSQARYAQ
jgi:RimJ/RimL family protein N-acetyltransferase